MKWDMHVHTYYSDGLLSPRDVVQAAVEKGLNGIAITDHDSVLGIREAEEYSNNYPGFQVIPGIEFSSLYKDEEVHILGYFIDYNHKSIIEKTKVFRDARNQRARKIVEKLNDLNISITMDNVLSTSKDDFVGRAHIARAMIAKGYVDNIQEAFLKYLNRGRPAYVERYYMSVGDTIQLIKEVGGIPILAHPGLLKDKNIIYHCIDEGILGLECMHSKHGVSDTRTFKKIARKNKLLISGGSDCHGERVGGKMLLGEYYIDQELIGLIKGRL